MIKRSPILQKSQCKKLRFHNHMRSIVIFNIRVMKFNDNYPIRNIASLRKTQEYHLKQIRNRLSVCSRLHAADIPESVRINQISNMIPERSNCNYYSSLGGMAKFPSTRFRGACQFI